MKDKIKIERLTKDRFNEAVDLVFKAGLDSREEIEHHLEHLDAHFVALYKDKIIGVIGWYQDNVNYAKAAMGDKFPGEEVFWVGFFTVDEDYRGAGVGYVLLKTLEGQVLSKGANELWVSSVPETRKYYERQGFVKLIEGKIDGNKKYFMIKKLKQ